MDEIVNEAGRTLEEIEKIRVAYEQNKWRNGEEKGIKESQEDREI